MEMVEVGIASKRRILGIAVIHHTTLKPTTLELLASWSPSRPWYAEGPGVPAPALTKGGGVRLDDPRSEERRVGTQRVTPLPEYWQEYIGSAHDRCRC